MESGASNGILSLAGDVIASGAALAGLILVYLGGVANEYGGFAAADQDAVREKFQRRAWFAAAGIILSILASGFGLLGKWLGNSLMVGAGAAMLAFALAWAVVITVLLASEVN